MTAFVIFILVVCAFGMVGGAWIIYSSARQGATIGDTLVGIVMLILATAFFSSILTMRFYWMGMRVVADYTQPGPPYQVSITVSCDRGHAVAVQWAREQMEAIETATVIPAKADQE